MNNKSNNIYAYMRISTSEERGKQKFQRQEKVLEKYAKDNNMEYLLTFKDDKSGKSFARDEWQKLEKIAQKGDTIVFYDISRFTRERENGFNKYMELMEKGINLVFINNPTLNTDYMKTIFNNAENENWLQKEMIQFIARIMLKSELDRKEQERITISKNITDGIKASDKKSGRKVGQLDKMNDSLKADILSYLADRNIKGSSIMKKHNISRNTFKKYVAIVNNDLASNK